MILPYSSSADTDAAPDKSAGAISFNWIDVAIESFFMTTIRLNWIKDEESVNSSINEASRAKIPNN